MYEPWNEFELKKPAQVTVPVPVKDACNVQRVTAAIQRYLQNHKHHNVEFSQTAALLARLMARRKNSFRGMIGFRAVIKVNTALCRLLRVDLLRDLTLFRNCLPDFESDAGCYELPTRNNFDYLLVRLVSGQRIYRRIRECCKDAAEYFAKMLRNNFFMDTNALLLAVLAKLHNLSALLGNKCVALYNQLVHYRSLFQNVGNYSFLPVAFAMPEKLETFAEQTLPTSVQPIADAVVQLSKELIGTPPSLLRPTLLIQRRKVDMGTEVNRVAFPQKSAFNVDSELCSVEDVKQFIRAQNKSRKQPSSNCVTKKITPHEWLGAIKLFERKLLAKEEKKALSKFRKFISTKI